MAYCFMLRVPSEALPVAAHRAADGDEHPIFRLSEGRAEVWLPKRKNRLTPSSVLRACWCNRCVGSWMHLSTPPPYGVSRFEVHSDLSCACCGRVHGGIRPWCVGFLGGIAWASAGCAEVSAPSLTSHLRWLAMDSRGSCDVWMFPTRGNTGCKTSGVVCVAVPVVGRLRSHGLRRGHAEDLREAGASTDVIKAAGDWRSRAYLHYQDLQRREFDAVRMAHQGGSAFSDESEVALHVHTAC